ncbi:hypothetical protein D3C84_805810 [compost metagenome]
MRVVEARREVEQCRGDNRCSGGVERTVATGRSIEIPWRHRLVAEPFKVVVGERQGMLGIPPIGAFQPGLGEAIDGPGLPTRPVRLIGVTLEGIATQRLAADRVVLQRMVGGAVGSDEMSPGEIGMRLSRQAKAGIAAIVGRPVQQRQIGHGVDGRAATATRVVQRAPGRQIGTAGGGDDACPQTLGSAQRGFGTVALAGQVPSGNRATVKNKTYVMGVRIVSTVLDQP